MGEDRTFDNYKAPLIIGRATNRKRDVIAFEVHPALKMLVKDSRIFARLNINFISALADVKLCALFRDFINRERNPASLDVTLDYRELRVCLGAGEDHYKVFKDFEFRMLKPLVDAVDGHTDLHLSYEPVKTGGKLTHLKFTMRPQSWQLQLFEAEHAKRLVEELAKNFDEPVIDTKAMPAVEAATDKAEAGLIDQCVKMDVSSFTVEWALKAHDATGVGEIIDYTKKQLAKKDKKGEAYETGQYIARMLNDGVGVRSLAERQKTEAAKRKPEEQAAACAAQTAAEEAEKTLKQRFEVYKKTKAETLLAQRPLAAIAQLGQIVADALTLRPMCQRRKEVGCDSAKLDRRKFNDKIIYGGYVLAEALKLSGTPEDNNFEAFKAREAEPA